MDEPVDPAWQRVADAVKARLIEMRTWGNLAEVARRSDVSDATWRNLLRGHPVTREKKLIQICDYLGWTLNSIELILAGQPAERAQPAERSAVGEISDLEKLRQEVQEIRHGLESVRDRLEEVSSVMTGWEHQMAPGPRKGRNAAGPGGRPA